MIALLAVSLLYPASIKQTVYPPQFFAIAIYLPNKVAYAASAIYYPYTYTAIILTPTALSVGIGIDYSDYSPTVTAASMQGYAIDLGYGNGIYSVILSPDPVMGYSGGYTYLDGFSYATISGTSCALVISRSSTSTTSYTSAEVEFGSKTYGMVCSGYAVHQLTLGGAPTNLYVVLNDSLYDVLSYPSNYNGSSFTVYYISASTTLPTPADLVAVAGGGADSILAAINSSGSVKLYYCTTTVAAGCSEISSSTLYSDIGTPLALEYLGYPSTMYLVIGSQGIAILNVSSGGGTAYIYRFAPSLRYSPVIYSSLYGSPAWAMIPLRDGSALVLEFSSGGVSAWRVEVSVGGALGNVTGFYLGMNTVTLSFVADYGYVAGFVRLPQSMSASFEGSIQIGVYRIAPVVASFTFTSSGYLPYPAGYVSSSGTLKLVETSESSPSQSISLSRVAMAVSSYDLGTGTVTASVSVPNLPQLGKVTVGISASATWSPAAHIIGIKEWIDNYTYTTSTIMVSGLTFSTTTVLGTGVHTVGIAIGVDRYGVWHMMRVVKTINVLSTTVSTTGTTTSSVSYPSPSSPSSSPLSAHKVMSEEAVVVLALVLFVLLLLARRSGAASSLRRY